MQFLLVIFTIFLGHLNFYPCQEGLSPGRASGKTSERPYVFCSLAIFWKPQGSHIGVTSSVAENIPLALTRRRASGAQARGNLRTPLCVCSRAVFYLLKPQLSYVCPTPGQLPEDAQRLGVAEIDATAREQGMGQAGAGPGRGRCAPLCLEGS